MLTDFFRETGSYPRFKESLVWFYALFGLPDQKLPYEVNKTTVRVV